MVDIHAPKLCQADEDACKREVQAWCYHCSKNLCRVHLLKHVQLVEEKTREELHILADQLNYLSTSLHQLKISPNLAHHPFSALEQWRLGAHTKVDQIVDMKRQELKDILDGYEKAFLIKKMEQMKTIDLNKKLLSKLIEENDGTRQQIIELQSSIDETTNYLSSLDQHRIDVHGSVPDFSIIIEETCHPFDILVNPQWRDIEVVYVRLNGGIRPHRVLTRRSGNMRDLKVSFVDQYPQTTATSSETDEGQHQPKVDFLLATEVYNHRIHLQFEDSHLLSLIQDQDKIVFYEMPYSLEKLDHPCLPIPCSFRRLPNKEPFGVPIFLSLPRQGCRGQDVIEAILDTLDHFFPFNARINQNLYSVRLVRLAGGNSKAIKLHTILQDEIDLTQTNAQILIDIHSQIAEAYQQITLKQPF